MDDPAVTRLSIAAGTRTPAGTTNCYLVGDAVIDPADATDALDSDPDHVLVTHTHPDHVGGVATCADDAVVWANDGHVEQFRDATGVDPDRTFADGDRLPTDPPLSVVDAPGHAPDHVVFRLAGADGDAGAASRPALFVGDVAVAEGSVVVGAPDGDMRAYLATLERLRDLDPPAARLYPGHGPAVDEPRATFDRLVEHRLERERRVLSAVRAGVETVPEITDAAYDRDLSGVRDLAAATVRAHLEKLAHEGRLRWDGERARSL